MKLRLGADVLAALRATGDGWQTRINDMLRASLALGGKLPRWSTARAGEVLTDTARVRFIPADVWNSSWLPARRP